MSKVTYEGISVEVEIRDKSEHQQKNWVNGKFYETQRNGLLNHIYLHHRGQSFIDVGASIGNHTLFFAGICKSPRVASIEPFAPSFDHLKANIALNGFEPFVEVFNVACGAIDGETGVARYGGEGNVGMVKVVPGSEDRVQYAQMDTLFKDAVPFDVIKVDVEHHNKELITGMHNILKEWKAVLYVEAESPTQFDEVYRMLRPYGYYWTKDKFNHTPTYKFIKA